MPRPERLFHYTVGLRLPEILEDRAIKPTDANLGSRERPAVWTTRSPVWEETANKSAMTPSGERVLGTKRSTERLCGGLVRIAVRPSAAPIRWQQFVKTSGIKSKTVKRLAASAWAQGSNPVDWWVSYRPIPETEWLAVEIWGGLTWVPYGGWGVTIHPVPADEAA